MMHFCGNNKDADAVVSQYESSLQKQRQSPRRRRRRSRFPSADFSIVEPRDDNDSYNDNDYVVLWSREETVNDGAKHRSHERASYERIRTTRAKKRRARNPFLQSLLFAAAAMCMVLIAFGTTLDLDVVDAFHPSPRIVSVDASARLSSSSVSSLPASSRLFMSLASPPASSIRIPDQKELESMKVVELKELIKESGLNERGLLSRLKRKQDLVDFLVQASATITGVDRATDPDPVKDPQPEPPKPKRRKPLTMPAKKEGKDQIAATADDDTGSSESSPPTKSPLQAIFDRVNEQYPALRYLAEGNNTMLGDQDIRQRYHPMLQQAATKRDASKTGENDEEDEYQKPALSGDMDLIFVGTASCTPSITRGVSCTALRLHSLAKQQKQSANVRVDPSRGKKGRDFDVAQNSQSNLGTWLFDCGESTQLQIQKTPSVRPSKITKIFLSHAHGDHSFGLPGLLCLMGQDSEGKSSKAPIDVYGPEGLRLWLRTALRYSVSRICPRYRVHELKDVAMAPEWGYSRKWERYFFNKNVWYERQRGDSNNFGDDDYYWGAANHRRNEYPPSSDWLTHCDKGGTIEASELYGEVEGGRDIYPVYDHPLSSDGAPIWEVESDGNGDSGVKVYAAPMSHGIPCVGYVVQEANRPGRLRDELVKPICQRNIPALKKAGFRHPMKALAVIKDLPKGGSFTFPDGTVVTQKEAVEPARPGRKVVILGDTNSARSMENLARNADVVVHEATNTFLPALEHKDATLSSVTKDAIFHGHSTPYLAGDFCKRVGAKRLILNHFSARYTGDQSMDSISIMTRIEEQAIKASGLARNEVAAAWDFMIYPIPKAEGTVDDDDDDDG
mmetsp:Transcript_17743/g.49126  ORF Transcript_17743/g.49126 Transcript_17743/m.49126 type:complete len:846 (-) Transcript_17743:976-3513(-)